MTFTDFQQSLQKEVPPDFSDLLSALWWDAKGHWEKAHKIAQDVHTNDGSWVHAYLHRKEGDEFNAGYWYNRAGKSKSRLSLDEEWKNIVKALLER
ncbi:MAG: hypothetical protein KC618_05385 [Candidatus Omnitrophica bacterium]|nr:hypothetical protein [Candidatus Omnitrophota bacterium]